MIRDDETNVIGNLILAAMIIAAVLLMTTNQCSYEQARYEEHMKTHAEEPTDGR